MKTTAFSIPWLCITLFSFCNAEFPFKNDGLIGSALVVAGTNPYQVAILQRVSFNFDVLDGKKFICGGSLIDAQWVLTAAQCVANPNLRLMLGVNNIRVYEPYHVSIEISEEDIVVHPEYNATILTNDIALIRLPEPVEYNEHIRPVFLDTVKGSHINEMAFLSGWGRVSPFAPAADYLRQTTLKIISNDDCQKQLDQPLAYLRDSNLCTAGGLFLSEIGSCAGDSGAPLIVFNSKKARPEQIGIVSNPRFMCMGTEPTVYTRVSDYESWIAEVINLNSGSEPIIRVQSTTVQPSDEDDEIRMEDSEAAIEDTTSDFVDP